MAKRPSFQFYPSDWLTDTALRTCSVGARGLWMDMMCYMHEGAPYGHLKVNGKVILPPTLARMVGEPLDVVEGWLAELEGVGVFSKLEDGTIYSRRMVRDEQVREARAAGGKKGGNPALLKGKGCEKDNPKVNLKDNHEVGNEDNRNPTPSSSSSSSLTAPHTPQGGSKKNAIAINTFIAQCKENGETAIPPEDPIFEYANEIDLPHEYLHLAWREFVDRNQENGKRYKDWRKAFRNCVRGNWYKLWWVQPDGNYALTTNGVMANRKREAATA